MRNEKLRNVAIIAHVDHGKTTLVDEMLKQSGVYRENQTVVDRVMDSNDLERERGITILAKNTAVQYGDVKINIVDTPGHADFGGEVERILKMVNGVILLVDAAEGPMPQTRFVLSKALELGHRVIVVVNKIDRPDQRIHEVMDEVLELLLDLNATDEQFESPTLFCSGRQGTASYSPDVPGTDLKPLFETIINYIPAPEAVEPIEFVKISAPTIEMTFSVNDSPFAGREGKFVTSRQIRDRLFRETLKDVSLRVTEVEDSTDSFNVAGRGEMSLSILMETMRREGYEFQVSPPRVLFQEIDGVKCEPVERLVADVPNDCVGAVMEKLGARKGEFLSMNPVGNRTKLEFLVPSRGLFGYRNEFLTDTKGEGIMASVFEKYAPMKGEIQRRSTGSLVAFETGEAVTYGLFNAQERGTLFIGAGVPVYAGMIVGECPKQEDISVNVCKKKQLTNMRASGSDDALRLVTPKTLSLEQCLEFLADDELLECTPENLRLRKRLLDHSARMREASKKKNG